jgi:hypothetical protein
LKKKVKAEYNYGMSDFKLFWEEAVKVLYSEYENQNRADEFNLWINAIDYVDSHDSVVFVSVPSTFF